MLNQTTEPVRELSDLSVALTLVKAEAGNSSRTIQVQVKQMIAYDQEMGFTRLRLTGQKIIEVKESTDNIDRLIRSAASNLFSRSKSRT